MTYGRGRRIRDDRRWMRDDRRWPRERYQNAFGFPGRRYFESYREDNLPWNYRYANNEFISYNNLPLVSYPVFGFPSINYFY